MLVLGALLIGGKHLGMPDHHHGVMLGAAAGVLFGVSDVAIKAITGLIGDTGLLDALLSPWLIVAIAASTYTTAHRPAPSTAAASVPWRTISRPGIAVTAMASALANALTMTWSPSG